MADPREQVPAAAGRGHLRASHADREHAIEMLKAAFVAGMLTKGEFDLRVGQALASRTHADLAALTAGLPAGLAAAGSARPPARVRRRPLARAAAGSGGCLVIAAAAVWAAFILDPGPPAPSPYHGKGSLMFLIALAAVITAFGIMANGAVTSWEQRRSRTQLPPRPGPGGHALGGERRGGTGHGPVPPAPRTGHADLEAHKPRQHRQHTPTPRGRTPHSAKPAPGAA